MAIRENAALQSNKLRWWIVLGDEISNAVSAYPWFHVPDSIKFAGLTNHIFRRLDCLFLSFPELIVISCLWAKCSVSGFCLRQQPILSNRLIFSWNIFPYWSPCPVKNCICLHFSTCQRKWKAHYANGLASWGTVPEAVNSANRKRWMTCQLLIHFGYIRKSNFGCFGATLRLHGVGLRSIILVSSNDEMDQAKITSFSNPYRQTQITSWFERAFIGAQSVIASVW